MPNRTHILIRGLILHLMIIAAWAQTTSLDVTIRHTHNGKPLLLDSLRYPDATGTTFSVTRLSYLIGNPTLESSDGEFLTLSNQFAYVDAAKRRTRFRLHKIPTNHYRAVRFDIGISPEPNLADRAWPTRHPLNPLLNNLRWDWDPGYIFLALEGRFRDPENPLELAGYVYHLAREANRVPITLTLPLDLHHPAHLLVDFDIATLLNSPRPIHFSTTATSTHSHPGDPIADALRANLPAAFRPVTLRSFRPKAPEPALPPLYLPATHTPHRLQLPRNIAPPTLPPDNPLTVERIALGKTLFHSTLLSADQHVSCASCHKEAHAFADPVQFSTGIGGQPGSFNSMPLLNLAWKNRFFWDGRAPSLRQQVLDPIDDPKELGLGITNLPTAIASFSNEFKTAFGTPDITAEKTALALEAFLLSLTSFDSRFDQALAGNATLTPEEKRGFELFFTEFEPRSGRRGADCFHCHGGALFTDNDFHNNGLADNLDKFATPSLRHVALTAPYMHDGRFETLEDVISHYNDGIHPSTTLSPNLAKRKSLNLSSEDQAALVAFLKAL